MVLPTQNNKQLRAFALLHYNQCYYANSSVVLNHKELPYDLLLHFEAMATIVGTNFSTKHSDYDFIIVLRLGLLHTVF